MSALYEQAEINWRSALGRLNIATTRAEREAAQDDVNFWGSKMAHYWSALQA